MALIRVVAAVVRQGNQFLVCQRPLHKRHGGCWEFPGGKIEAGESDLDATRRELEEELGVHTVATGPELFARHDAGSAFHIVFIEARFAGTPVCHEHIAHQWATLAVLGTLHLAPTDRAFVEFLHEEARKSSASDGAAL